MKVLTLWKSLFKYAGLFHSFKNDKNLTILSYRI
jgi:hypothetical protein